jgi:hypothetical protein
LPSRVVNCAVQFPEDGEPWLGKHSNPEPRVPTLLVGLQQSLGWKVLFGHLALLANEGMALSASLPIFSATSPYRETTVLREPVGENAPASRLDAPARLLRVRQKRKTKILRSAQSAEHDSDELRLLHPAPQASAARDRGRALVRRHAGSRDRFLISPVLLMIAASPSDAKRRRRSMFAARSVLIYR